MERLPKNPSKSLESKGLTHLPKRIRRWDLLLVDDHGKVMSFQYIKGLVIFFMILLISSLAVSVFLFCLYTNTQDKLGELQTTLETSRKHAAVMQQETRDLMVRLAEAQAKVPERQTRKVPKSEKKKAAIKKTVSPPAPPPVDARAERPGKTAETGSGPPETRAAPLTMKTEVGVFDFSAVHDPKLNRVQVRFIIKNINRNISVIQGHIFAVMKTDGPDQKEWITLPPVDLIAGRPGHIQAGQYFKIRNYKTMALCTETLTGPRRFARVSVLVYSPKGVLLLEKTYSVDIDVSLEEEKAPPAPDPDSGEQPRENGPQDKPVPTEPDAGKPEMQTVIPLPAQDTDPDAKPGEAINE